MNKMYQVAVCVTVFAAIAAASQDNNGDCMLKCASANEVLQNVSMHQTECYWPDSPLLATDLNLDINPYFDTRNMTWSCSNELRWIPHFQATWRTPKNVTRYHVQVHDLPQRKLRHVPAPPPLKSTCFYVEYDNLQLGRCEYTCKDVPSPSVLVRVLVNGSESLFMDESTINFHRWFQGSMYEGKYNGLSLFYRRQSLFREYKIPPVVGLPNPRHWATILKIHNNSDSGEVSLVFDLATSDVRVGMYVVTLFKFTSLDRVFRTKEEIQINQKSLIDNTTASLTFYNVTAGTYFVRVRTRSNINHPYGQCLTKETYEKGDKLAERLVESSTDPCFSDGWGTSNCLIVDSGLFILTDGVEPQTAGNGLVFMIAGMVAAMVVVVIVVSLLIFTKFRKRRQKDNIQRVIVIPPSPGKSALPEEGDTSKPVTVFLVYSRDNRAHIHVVNKLAQLLRQTGNCNVILDMEDKAIARYTAIEWADAQLKESDKVIFIKSEGALRRMQLENDKVYAKMETENLGLTFTASVRAMDVRSSHNRGNYMVVSFAYSNPKGLREDKLLTIVGNNSQFQLMAELNSLLLSIWDLSQCQSGLFRTVYAGQGEELSSTISYTELQKAIDEAVIYHNTQPHWFQYEAELRVKKPEDGSTVIEAFMEETEPEVPLSMFTGCTLPPIVQAMVPPSSQESLNQSPSYLSGSTCSEHVDLSELPCWPADEDMYCDSGFRSISQSDLGVNQATPPTVSYPYFRGSDHTTGMPDFYAPESVTSSYTEDLDKQGEDLLPNGSHSDHHQIHDILHNRNLLFDQLGQDL